MGKGVDVGVGFQRESPKRGGAGQQMAGTRLCGIASLTTPRKQELEVNEATRSQNPSDCFLL